jgi:hypothetical protein
LLLLFQWTFLETDNFQRLFRKENLERVIEINGLNDRRTERNEGDTIDRWRREREREVERLKR